MAIHRCSLVSKKFGGIFVGITDAFYVGINMPLTDLVCRKIKSSPRPRKLSDGGGLYLLVDPKGGRYWRLAYRFGGKQKTFALGIYPTVSLADARAARDEAKRQLAEGIDPSQARKKERLAAKLSAVLRDDLDENGGGDLDFEAAAGSGVMIVADLQLCKFFRRRC